MMDEEIRLSAQPIPKIFQSYLTGTFFERCIECDRYLLDVDLPYFIEKAIKKYAGLRGHDVIFEYAICINCANEIRQKMSKESTLKLMEYMEKNRNAGQRAAIVEQYPDNPEKWIETCLIKGNHIDQTSECQIFAQCVYDRLLLPAMPYMISGAAVDEMAELLSNKTLGEMDDFIGKHFGPPAELFEGPRKVIFV